MLGYYHNPEATAEVIDADGYFHTGDLAKRDPVTGEYTITGRIKNMIVIGNGKKVFPEEIEYLLEMPGCVGMHGLWFGVGQKRR